MARGENPNSRANLKKPDDFTSKELRERAKKGAEASAKVRRQLKTFRELDTEHTTEEERLKMLAAVKLKAVHGNLKAFEIYRDTMGMNPRDQAGISTEYADDGLTAALVKAASKVWEDE